MPDINPTPAEAIAKRIADSQQLLYDREAHMSERAVARVEDRIDLLEQLADELGILRDVEQLVSERMHGK